MSKKGNVFSSLVREEWKKAVYLYRVVDMEEYDTVQSLVQNGKDGNSHAVASLLPCKPGEVAVQMTLTSYQTMKCELVWVQEKLSPDDMPLSDDTQVKLLIACTDYLKHLRDAYEDRIRGLAEKANLEREIRAATEMERLKVLLAGNPGLLRKVEEFKKKYPAVTLELLDE